MLEDRYPELMRSISGVKILTCASSKAQQTFAGKGITPAIFLSQYYRNKMFNSLEVTYTFKDKHFKPIPEFIPIDFREYQAYSEQVVGKYVMKKLAKCQMKFSKELTTEIFANKSTVESHLNNQTFHWFEQANSCFFQALALEKSQFRISTLEQPLGIAMIIQVDNQKNCREQFQELEKQSNSLMKKLFLLNPNQLKNLKIMVIILFDCKEGTTIQQAFQWTDTLKKDYQLDQNLISRLEINGKQSKDMTVWSMYTRPVFHYNYTLKPSDPILLVSEEMHEHLRKTVNHHKDMVRQTLEIRMDFLIKKYEEYNTAKNKFLGFFKNNAPLDKNYNLEERETRQLADRLFLIEDYKRAFEIYKNLSKKMQNRDKEIESNISEMIQMCLGMARFHNIKLKDDPFGSIQRHSQKIMKTYSNLNKTSLLRYLIFLMYMFHTFRNFPYEFIKDPFYHCLKIVSGEDSSPLSSITVLLHQQYTCLSLFTKSIDYRHYCYELTRVAWKFSNMKLHNHALRCLLLVQSLYKGTFMVIEKYVMIQLSKVYLEMRNYEEALTCITNAWQLHIRKHEPVEFDSKHFTGNHSRIIKEIQRVRPELIFNQAIANVPVPILSNLNIQTFQEMLENDDKSGQKWEDIGDNFTQSKEMLSMGLNKGIFGRLFRQFDKVSAEEKSMLYQLKRTNPSEELLKKHSRIAYIGQPIRISVDMRNPLNSEIDIENIKFVFNSAYQGLKIVEEPVKKSQLKQGQRIRCEMTVIPEKQGFLQLQKIQWMLLRILSQQELDLARDDIHNCYYKLNISDKTGLLKAEVKTKESFYFEGEITEIIVVLENVGSQDISDVYMAVGSPEIFGFKEKLLLEGEKIEPGKSITIPLQIKIPLLASKVKSGQLNLLQKCIFLYKTPSPVKFRSTRVQWNIRVHRVINIQDYSCERLSTHLHLLTFVSSQKSTEEILNVDWMIVKKGFQIVKEEVNSLKKNSYHYYFLRKGDFERQMHMVHTGHGQAGKRKANNYPTEFLNQALDDSWADFDAGKPKEISKKRSENDVGDIEEAMIDIQENLPQLQIPSKSTENPITKKIPSSSIEEIDVCFLWNIQNPSSKSLTRMGCISLQKIPITFNRALPSSENGEQVPFQNLSRIGTASQILGSPSQTSSSHAAGASLPFNFKIKYRSSLEHNFSQNPVLQIPVQIKLKNIFSKDSLTIQTYFTQDKDIDASWQGLIHRELTLAEGEQAKMEMKFVVLRNGIFNLADSIKYIVSKAGKSGGVNITHSQFQSLYLEIVKIQRGNQELVQVKEEAIKNEENTNDQFEDFMNFDFETNASTNAEEKPNTQTESEDLI